MYKFKYFVLILPLFFIPLALAPFTHAEENSQIFFAGSDKIGDSADKNFMAYCRENYLINEKTANRLKSTSHKEKCIKENLVALCMIEKTRKGKMHSKSISFIYDSYNSDMEIIEANCLQNADDHTKTMFEKVADPSELPPLTNDH